MRRVLILLLVLAACGRGGPEGATLRAVVVRDAPGGLETDLATEAAGATLFTRDSSGATRPGIASSWRFVDDGQTLILRLKPMKWSDGKPLVAADVAQSFRRLAAEHPAGLASIAGSAGPASKLGVLAPTTRVVEIRLSAAAPDVLDWLAQPALAITRPGAMLGTYRQKTEGRLTILSRVAARASDTAQPARIEISATDAATKAITGFLRGGADVVVGEGLNGIAAAQDAGDRATLHIEPAWGSYGWLANTRTGPLADIRLRRALAMSADRPRLVARFAVPEMTPLTGLTQAAVDSGMVAAPDWQPIDPPARLTQARALLTAAGFSAQNPLRLTLLLPPGDDHLAVADAIKSDWSQLGILVAVTVLPQDRLNQAVTMGDYDLALSQRIVPVADRAALLAPFRCAARLYCNPAADAALAEAALTGGAARDAALARAEAMMLADVPEITLFSPVRWALVARGVTGWTANPAGSHPLALLGRETR